MLFTISARSKPSTMSVTEYLRANYANFPLKNIDSLFGFVKYTPLYGGRFFEEPELSSRDVKSMYRAKIGLRLPLTNHDVSDDEYKKSRYFLEKYHRKGNAIIVTNDKLARYIKRDFPRYRLEASVIKNINSNAKIEEALEIYDTVVLPMHFCQEDEFLRAAPHKDRITLFANGGCALNCPSKMCYPSMSKANKARDKSLLQCSQPIKARMMQGMVDFDLQHLSELGYTRFKVLRSREHGLTGY